MWIYRRPGDNRFEINQSFTNFITHRSDEEDSEEESEEEEVDMLWIHFLGDHVLESITTYTNILEIFNAGFVYSTASSPFAEDWEEFLDRLSNGPHIFQNTNFFNSIQCTYPFSESDKEIDDDSKYHFVKIYVGYIMQQENETTLTNDVFDLNTFWHNTIDHPIPHIFFRFVLYHRFMRLIPLDNEADTGELTRDVLDIRMFWKSATEPALEMPIRSFQAEEILEDNLQDALEHYPIIFR